MASNAKFRWNTGIDAENFWSRFEACCRKLEIKRGNVCRFFFPDNPRALHTPELDLDAIRIFLREKCGLYWDLSFGDDPSWFSVVLYSQHWERGYDCARDGRLIQMLMCFSEDIPDWSLNEPVLRRAEQKYFQIFEFFREMGCSVVSGYNDVFAGGYEPESNDPDLEHPIFRFAKTGTNILIAPFEERRMWRPNDYGWRVVIA